MAQPSDLVSEVVELAEGLPPGGTRGPTYRNLDDRRRAEDKIRRTEAVSLKLAGLTYDQIAEKMGLSFNGARDMVLRTLERAENRVVEEMRDIENARLDRAQAAVWSGVLGGDLRAIDTFLKISQRRARLNGLDAPTAINLSVSVRQEMETALAILENTILGEVISESREDSSLAG